MTEQARAPRPLAAITGGSSGIGKAFAEALGPTHDLLLIARDEDRLAAVALDVRSRFGSAVDVLAADLSSDAGIELAAQRLVAEPALAMLINDAGFGSRGLFWETDFAGQVAMHQVHVMATMRLTHAALGQMVARNAGTIINVSSIAAFMRRAGSVSYCSTKSWVATFTEGLYLELESVGSRVRVQALALTRNRAAAEDLVHDSVCNALAARESFIPGTNFAAWMHRILRNRFISDLRRRRDAVDVDDLPEGLFATGAAHEDRLALKELSRAIAGLPADQREALMLVAVQGMSYEELAESTGCPVGTAKSRVFRARRQLQAWMLGETPVERLEAERSAERSRVRRAAEAPAAGRELVV